MTEQSTRFALPLLQAGQAQKELFHNEALVRVDALLHPAVAEIATTTPPTAPGIGRSWIVGPGATGVWSGHTGAIATWTGGGWRFVQPVAGMTAWLADRSIWAWHDGMAWRDEPIPSSGLSVAGMRVVGPRQPAISAPTGGGFVDAEARAALSAILAALCEHGLIAT